MAQLTVPSYTMPTASNIMSPRVIYIRIKKVMEPTGKPCIQTLVVAGDHPAKQC